MVPARSLLMRLYRAIVDNSALLLIGAVIALVWANLGAASYESFSRALRFAVNDIGMAFFFAIAAKEVFEATLPGGALASPRIAGLPVLAASGGMIGPAFLFLTIVQFWRITGLEQGWAIPCATDIAFSALVARVIFGRGHPAIPFLLLLAIADDALGLVILAVFYPIGPSRLLDAVLGVGAGMALACMFRRRGVKSFWPYVIASGALSWVGLWKGGLHPALALVPIVLLMPHAARDLGIFDEREARQHDTLNEFEHWWKGKVEVILLVFGLVNAGVFVTSVGPGTWAVLGAMLLGKPFGIGLFIAIGRALGLELSPGIGWRETVVIGTVSGIGFTVALFFATAAFPAGPLLDQTKMGALFTFSAALIAAALAVVLQVGRFSRAVQVR